MQYPSPPPLPTFAATVERAGTTTTGSFEGTSAAAPLSGVAAVITWGNYVAEAAIRIAVPKPGELAALSQSVLSAASYTARPATGAATDPKLAQEADAVGGGVPREPVERALRVRARRPCRCPDEPAELRADDRRLRRLRRERRGAHVRRPGRDHASPPGPRSSCTRSRPTPTASGTTTATSRPAVRPLQERARRPGRPSTSSASRSAGPVRAAKGSAREDRRVHLDAQGSRRHPTAGRRRSRWSRRETAPRPSSAQLVSPDPHADIRPRWTGSSAAWDRRSPQK